MPATIGEAYRAVPNAFATALLMLIALISFTASSFADIASDQIAIDRLVQQGKFDHAEFLCREQLQGKVTAERRAAFTVELLRVLTEKARQSTMLEADAIFRDASNVAQAYLRADQRSAQRWLVEFQLALLPRLRGDLRQWQMGGVKGDALHLRYLRDSLKQLRALAKRLEEEGRKPRGQRNRNGLSEKAMRELQGRVALELGKTYRAQAEAYPPGSNDRSLAAAEGERVLDRIAPTAMTPKWWWHSRIEMLACLRLKGDWVATKRRIEVMLATTIPAGGKAELRAEAIRGALARSDWKRTKTLVSASVPPMDLSDPDLKVAADELGLAYVEAYLALATRSQQTGDSTAARDYESRAAAAVDARVSPSPYWTRRVESLLARGAGTQSGSTGGFPLTVRAARGLYRQGKLSEAATAYQRAAKQAAASGDRNESFSLIMTAAGLLVQADEKAQAAKLLRERALENADLPAAPDAHLLAIKLRTPGVGGESVVGSTPNGNVAAGANEYRQLLDEHLKWWQQGETAEQVTWWRGRAREHAEEYPAALDDYLSIPAGFKDHESVVAAIERCVNSISGVGSNANDATVDPSVGPDKPGLVAAADKLVSVAMSEKASAATRDAAAVSAVRISLLGPAKNLPPSVDALVSRMSQRAASDGAADGSTDGARLVLAEGLHRIGRKDAASREIAKVTNNASAEQWLNTLRLAQPSVSASLSERAGSAAWRLMLVERGQSSVSRLNASQRLVWDRSHVMALVDKATPATNRLAAEKIQELITQTPKDAEVRQWHARILTALNEAKKGNEENPEQFAAALAAWRVVVSGSPPTSPRWYEAKYELARLHYQKGDRARAAQMIELLQALHPDLGGGEQKSRFTSLLQKCLVAP